MRVKLSKFEALELVTVAHGGGNRSGAGGGGG
jgi:hypothetical protein